MKPHLPHRNPNDAGGVEASVAITLLPHHPHFREVSGSGGRFEASSVPQ